MTKDSKDIVLLPFLLFSIQSDTKPFKINKGPPSLSFLIPHSDCFEEAGHGAGKLRPSMKHCRPLPGGRVSFGIEPFRIFDFGIEAFSVWTIFKDQILLLH